MQERSERLAQAIAQALQWLRIRDLSTQELARRLAGEGYTDTEIAKLPSGSARRATCLTRGCASD